MSESPLPETQAIRLEAPFGHLAVAKGFVTRDQVRECLDAQADLIRQGVNKRLGDIMIERKYLLPHQVESVLLEQMDAPSTRNIGNYELITKIGEGGMGAVLKAQRKTDGAMVALKVLFRRLATDEQYIARFRREAEIGLTLNHPNLVRCLEVGETDEVHYMALEYVDGEDLGQLLQRFTNLPEVQALAIILEAARGIRYAHEKGLVHRDVKPGNIMLTAKGEVKVMDFGIARHAVDEDFRLTLTGIVMGTPHYISPEQVEGVDELDGRSDVYSLGVTLFHMLTGRPPYVGGNLYEVFNAHLTKNVPDPRTYNPAITSEVAELVLRMCARDRALRTASMSQVIVEISRALGLPSSEESIEVPTVKPRQRTGAAAARMATTQAAYADVVEQLRCPRCSVAFAGDPVLVAKGQRLRCPSCGLVFPAPISPPPPQAILPEEIQLEEAISEAAINQSLSGGPGVPLGRRGSAPAPGSLELAEHLELQVSTPRERLVEPVPESAGAKWTKTVIWWIVAAVCLGLAVWLARVIISGRMADWFK